MPLSLPVAAHLDRVRRVIDIEPVPDLLSDDAWELLDDVQAFIANRLDAILVTPDGIYDQHLQRL